MFVVIDGIIHQLPYPVHWKLTQDLFDNWVDDKVEEWHTSDTGKKLHEYLEMKRETFNEWVENPAEFYKKYISKE